MAKVTREGVTGFLATVAIALGLSAAAAAFTLGFGQILKGPVKAEPRGAPERQDEFKERQVVAMLENATYVFLPRTGGCWAYFEVYSSSGSVPKRSFEKAPCSLARHYMSDYSLQLLETEEQRLGGPIK